MMVKNSGSYDVTDILKYNFRHLDLYAWVLKKMKTYEHYSVPAGNTRTIMFSLLQSAAMNADTTPDLSKGVTTDKRGFEGGMTEPKC